MTKALQAGAKRLIENEEIMKEAYAEYPREHSYPMTYMDGIHNCLDNSKVIYCNDETDIRRCNKCGHEFEKCCNFEEDYN